MSLPPFQVLLDQHGPAVHRFLLASVGASDADDCYQEACIAALRAYPGPRARPEPQGLADDRGPPQGGGRPPGPRAPARAGGARARAGRPRRGARATREDPLWAQVRELPEKQRAAVFLRSVGDLSYAEVATAMGCSQDAARRSVHEGLKRLRQEVPS